MVGLCYSKNDEQRRVNIRDNGGLDLWMKNSNDQGNVGPYYYMLRTCTVLLSEYGSGRLRG